MWYDRNPVRLLEEKEIMGRAFPRARLVRLSSGHLAWVLGIVTNQGGKYLVQIRYPEGFPAAYPLAHVLDPPISGAPHQYADGHLCLFSTNDRPERSYEPSRTTVATIAAWVAAWLASYEIWRASGTWPERRVA